MNCAEVVDEYQCIHYTGSSAESSFGQLDNIPRVRYKLNQETFKQQILNTQEGSSSRQLSKTS